MTQMKVYRNGDGVVVHVGDWEYGLARVPVFDEDTKQQIYDELPGGGFIERTKQIFLTPLPDDYTEGTANIVVGYDGGLYEDTDPRRLG